MPWKVEYPPCRIRNAAELADYFIANGVAVGVAENATTTWISVEERLPYTDENVLVICNGKYKNLNFLDAYELAAYDSDEEEWILDGYPEAVVKVTHWMPLPQPPKGVE